ncbi:MAG: T9SS type A sorting domain-containing protein [Chitinophagales bacterium]|nr:T9SS type A sorting domain-containing protein [Chitinophagales bacterium]
MQKTYLLLTLTLFISICKAQVPNNGFENWAALEPTDWYTSIGNGYDSTIYQSADAHGGASSVHGIVNINSNGQIGGPQLSSGTIPNSFLGFPVTQNFDSCRYYFKFNPVGGDQLQVLIGMYEDATQSYLFQDLKLYTAAYTSWTEEAIKMTYAPGTSTNFFIDFSIVDSQGGFDSLHVGSEFYIDDVVIYNTTAGIKNNIAAQNNFEVFPNPSNDFTNIRFHTSQMQKFDVDVFSLMGNKIKGTTLHSNSGINNFVIATNDLINGYYFVQLKNESGEISRIKIAVQH